MTVLGVGLTVTSAVDADALLARPPSPARAPRMPEAAADASVVDDDDVEVDDIEDDDVLLDDVMPEVADTVMVDGVAENVEVDGVAEIVTVDGDAETVTVSTEIAVPASLA